AGSSTPMRRIRSGCCACVVSGHTATEVPISVMKSRRLIAPGLREGDRTASNLALGAGGRHFAAMSALGQKQTFALHQPMSALPPCVDGSELARTFLNVCSIGRCSHVFGLFARFT